jgi:uncharacterized protein (TIGR03437 family)
MAAASSTDQISGTLTIRVADYFKEHRSETQYLVNDASHPGQTYELHFSTAPTAQLQTGMVITGRGHKNGRYLENAEILTTKPAATSLPTIHPVTGVQKTLVYILRSATTQSTFTNSELSTIMFAQTGLSINTLYRQSSFNSVSFDGDVVGPFIVNDAYCDTDAIAAQADQQATASMDISTYSHRIYMLPVDKNCGGNWGGITEGLTSSWINTGIYSPLDTNIDVVIAHELGHQLNMSHAEAVKADGSLDEYGDNSCFMGDGAYSIVEFNVPHLIELGFLPLSNILQVSTSGIYQVAFAEQQTTAVQALQMPISGTFDTLYVSYRHPSGLDSGLSSAFEGGASIHIWDGSNDKSRLVTNYPWGGALYDGQTYTNGNISIQQVSHDSTGVTLSVTMAAYTPPPVPTIANSASGASTIAPGSLASIYGLNITEAITMSVTPDNIPGVLYYGNNVAGVSVNMGGQQTQLLFVSPHQINFWVPPTIQPGSLDVDVYFDYNIMAPQASVTVAERAVGMFVVPNPTQGQPAFLNGYVVYFKDGQASPNYYTVGANPNVSGALQLNTISVNPNLGLPYLSIYATGVNGIGGVPAVEITNQGITQNVVTQWSGPQDTYPGLDQINVPLPANLDGLVTIKIPGYDQTVIMQVGN